MASPADAFNLVKDAIEAIDVSDDQVHDRDAFQYYFGDPDEQALVDRHFALIPIEGPDLVTRRSGCEECDITLEIQVAYSLTGGTVERALKDGERIKFAIYGTIASVITEVQELSTAWDYVDRYVVMTRQFVITYSGVA